MENDLEKYAERKMPFFNLVVSLWSHKSVLENTIGYGFNKSVFTHSNGLCSLYASKREIDELVRRILEQIKGSGGQFKSWYEKAKLLNKEADDLIVEFRDGSFDVDPESYIKVFKVFVNNFGFCTILPYWVLYAVNQALENGEEGDKFKDILRMYEELKGETRYPQLIETIISKYFNKASDKLNVSFDLASCLHPEELRQVIGGEAAASAAELAKRWEWCAIVRDSDPYQVVYDFNQDQFVSSSTKEEEAKVGELRGKVAYRGIVQGRVKIVNSISDMDKFEIGDILVSIQSSPSLMPVILKCAAIITDEGGIMCHASIISRELKKPCIIGTKSATKIFKDGDLVEVDADKGTVKKL